MFQMTSGCQMLHKNYNLNWLRSQSTTITVLIFIRSIWLNRLIVKMWCSYFLGKLLQWCRVYVQLRLKRVLNGRKITSIELEKYQNIGIAFCQYEDFANPDTVEPCIIMLEVTFLTLKLQYFCQRACVVSKYLYSPFSYWLKFKIF